MSDYEETGVKFTGRDSSRSPPSLHSDHGDNSDTVEELRRQLQAAHLQLQDRDNRLATAESDIQTVKLQADAALQQRDERLAEATHMVQVARQREGHMSRELHAQKTLQDAAKEKEVLEYMQSLEQARMQQPPSPRGHHQQQAASGAVMDVIDDWNRRAPNYQTGNQHQAPPYAGRSGYQQMAQPRQPSSRANG